MFPVSEFGAHSPCACPQLTYVDFLAYDLLGVLRMFEPTCLDAFPNLKDFLGRFEVNPLILLLCCVFCLLRLPDASLVLELNEA